jgi:hypothetical protein
MTASGKGTTVTDVEIRGDRMIPSYLMRAKRRTKIPLFSKSLWQSLEATFRQCAIFRENYWKRRARSNIQWLRDLNWMNGSRALAEKRCIIQE